MNIYQKLVEIRKSITTFTKDTKGFGYTYVSGSQVLSKIKDKMDELEVLLIPQINSQEHSTFDYINDKGKEKTDFIVTGLMTYTWLNAENPEDKIEIPFQYMGQQDDISKAFGSGLTYSERYFLLKFFGIPTDDLDPDARNTTGKQQANHQKPISPGQLGLIKTQVKKLAMARKVTDEEVYTKLGFNDVEQLNMTQASKAIETLNKWVEQAKEGA